MGKLTYQTLRENVVDVIRMKILNHELVPGMRIIEQDFSDELGVSRGPIPVSYTHLLPGARLCFGPGPQWPALSGCA